MLQFLEILGMKQCIVFASLHSAQLINTINKQIHPNVFKGCKAELVYDICGRTKKAVISEVLSFTLTENTQHCRVQKP